jgi:peroxiredoxin
LSELRGKVVLVNFWATWCPPCRKEIPDLETLYGRFSSQGLVVLGISDEDVTKVEPFVRQHAILYPVLLDPKSTVTRLFELHGIPNTFLFDRSGRLVAEAIDMRTEKQFLAMLRTAGLQ